MLEINKANNNIATFGSKQAVDVDYTGSGFDRGHLNPQLYHCETNDSRKATNTLTNIAPQVPSFNQGIWNKFETTLYDISKSVLPSNNRFISNGRVNVPDHYWTAVCCDSSGANGALRNEGWSAGFVGGNVNNSSIFIYSIQNFLPTTSTTLFADYKDQNGNTVKNCLFNPTKADNIINEIASTDDRFIKEKTSLFSRWFAYAGHTVPYYFLCRAHLQAVMCAIKLMIWFTLCNTCVTVEDGYVELVFAIITPTFHVETSTNSTITDIFLPMSDTTDDSCRAGTAYTSGILAITSS
ncbi:unnamed protein product [Mytilus edulis]|uniref:Endonuclease n=1 Tax=Mytilus edulis TaxID=6550 RepID=A0A8S3RB16_MYTED|nr:unnamed protein product [Mytilus edulis]